MFEPIDLRRPTYIVLEVPAVLAARVLELRTKYRPDYAPLPAEITLIGSSGRGVLEPTQSAAAVIARVDEIAESTLPLKVRFADMETFPGSGVYFFPPVPREPFEELHLRLLEAGILCRSSPFPFRPHLTIARIASPKLGSKLLAESAPEGEFMIDQLAIYSQVGFDTRVHHRTRLRGSTTV
ncbi:MAG TPA: 2'-5' RNA ligase family protein [Thermoanaerobaculia bacterium]|nr:2'-5' RNA ligase family protein [Thermoanaerobaculia bacterium]